MCVKKEKNITYRRHMFLVLLFANEVFLDPTYPSTRKQKIIFILMLNDRNKYKYEIETKIKLKLYKSNREKQNKNQI